MMCVITAVFHESNGGLVENFRTLKEHGTISYFTKIPTNLLSA